MYRDGRPDNQQQIEVCCVIVMNKTGRGLTLPVLTNHKMLIQLLVTMEYTSFSRVGSSLQRLGSCVWAMGLIPPRTALFIGRSPSQRAVHGGGKGSKDGWFFTTVALGDRGRLQEGPEDSRHGRPLNSHGPCWKCQRQERPLRCMTFSEQTENVSCPERWELGEEGILKT